MSQNGSANNGYRRYHIETNQAPDIADWPSRFKVRVAKVGLARHLVTEMIQTGFDMPVVTSRPCMYGVYSGPVGGFAPREQLCVGCLRCTTEFPDFVQILPNPERQSLGDSYFTARFVDAVAYEAEGGRIPVKGAGYRGKFGGEGWDGMWTDMSEIVRPTRDGIHGREFISTVVDIGSKPGYLVFDQNGEVQDEKPQTISIPVPFLFDVQADNLDSALLYRILTQAAEGVESLAIVPLDRVLENNLRSKAVVPLLKPGELERMRALPSSPLMIEMDGWDEELYRGINAGLPDSLVCLRTPFLSGQGLLAFADAGVKVFHLTANYHGSGANGSGEGFVFDLIRRAHNTFVEAGRRDEVTLLGSGGIVAAEHLPKAIIAGLDAVALDVPLLVAMQGRFSGEFVDRRSGNCYLPRQLTEGWGVQRLMNLSAAWRDQLLEILGAMGLREVRRLRGEMGRAMFQKDLEREAFAGIEGYDD